MWAKMAKVSRTKLNGAQPAFYRNKVELAQYYMTRILPETSSLFATIMAGKGPLMAMAAEDF